MEIICYACGRGEQPENTLEAIRHCLFVDPSWRIEMDIQLTKDGKLVLLHDYNTARTTGEEQPIQALNWAEVHALNAGYYFQRNGTYPFRAKPLKIPLLESVFQEFPTAKLMLDLHSNHPKVVDLMIDLVEEYQLAKQVVIASHYDTVIQEFRKKRPKWSYGAPRQAVKKLLYSSFLYLDAFFPIQADVLMLPQHYGKISVLSQRILRHAKKHNKPIWAWLYEGETVQTVNTKAAFKDLQALGVQGVFTEHPRQLKAELGI